MHIPFSKQAEIYQFFLLTSNIFTLKKELVEGGTLPSTFLLLSKISGLSPQHATAALHNSSVLFLIKPDQEVPS